MPCVAYRTKSAVKHTHVTRRNKYRYDVGKMQEPIPTVFIPKWALSDERCSDAEYTRRKLASQLTEGRGR